MVPNLVDLQNRLAARIEPGKPLLPIAPGLRCEDLLYGCLRRRVLVGEDEAAVARPQSGAAIEPRAHIGRDAEPAIARGRRRKRDCESRFFLAATNQVAER